MPPHTHPPVLAVLCCAEVFSAMTAAKERVTVLDWGIANATLEEVSGSRGGRRSGLPCFWERRLQGMLHLLPAEFHPSDPTKYPSVRCPAAGVHQVCKAAGSGGRPLTHSLLTAHPTAANPPMLAAPHVDPLPQRHIAAARIHPPSRTLVSFHCCFHMQLHYYQNCSTIRVN